MTGRLLWVVEFYDGPVAGLACHDGRVVWFDGDPADGRWTLRDPDPADLVSLLADKAAFERHVGTHWSYDVPTADRRRRPADRHAAYYAARDPDERRARRARLTARPALATVERWANPGR